MPNAIFTLTGKSGLKGKFRMNIWTRTGKSLHKARVLELLLLLGAVLGLSPATAGSLQSMQLSDGELILQFDGPVGEATSFALDGPQRLAIDIAGAEPGSADAVSSTNIARVRQGRVGSAALRLVLDLSQPTVVNRVRMAPNGRQMTVSLGSATMAQFVAAVRQGQRAFPSPLASAPTLEMARRPQRGYHVSVPIGRASNGVGLPQISGPADTRLPLVVIDAGHGGHDPGALSPDGRYREEDVTLAIARNIRTALVASGRVRVALTRDSDRFLVLEERYGIARRLHADLFISIHADAAENPTATGAAIYTLSEVASDREALRLAARENRANILNGIDLGGQNADVRSILIDLTQRETMNLSSDFARTLQRSANGDIPFRTSSHRFAGFVVLKAPDMPSILLETGFITNPVDSARLVSSEGQASIARGVRQAVLTHFARQIARGSQPAGVASNAGGNAAP